MHKEYLILWDNYVFYEDGRIYNKSKGKFLKGYTHPNGYVTVSLKCTDGKFRMFLLHRVVWTFFNGEISEGMQVNHIDENKRNNALSNLNLMTPKENINYGTGIERMAAKLKGHLNPMFGKHHSEEARIKLSEKLTNNTKNSKPVVAVDKDGNVVYEFASTKEAGRNGFSSSAVSQCCRNCYKGYQWHFKSDWLEMNKL